LRSSCRPLVKTPCSMDLNRALSLFTVPRMTGSPLPIELREAPFAVGPRVAKLQVGVSCELVELVDADADPTEPWSGAAVVFETHGSSERPHGGRVDLDEDAAAVAQQVAAPPRQHRGRAADPDVAVEEQCGAPASVARHAIEDRTVQHGSAPAVRNGEGGERDVDAETDGSGPRQDERVTGRPAADVEDRTLRAFQHPLF